MVGVVGARGGTRRSVGTIRRYYRRKNRCGFVEKRKRSMKISHHCGVFWSVAWGDLGMLFGRNYANSCRPRVPFRNTYSTTSISTSSETPFSSMVFLIIRKRAGPNGMTSSHYRIMVGVDFTFVRERGSCEWPETTISEKRAHRSSWVVASPPHSSSSRLTEI